VEWIPSIPEISVNVRWLENQVRAITREAAAVVGKAWPILQRKVEPTIKQLVQEDFRIKSRGGAGADGRRWRKLAQSTIDKKNSDVIGIEFGDMYESLRVVPVKRNETMLLISYENVHAEFFDEQRPLLPDGDVPKWIEKMEPLVEEVVTQNIQRLIDKAR
jgi:hypothetical protein